MAHPFLSLDRVSRSFGSTRAVDALSLSFFPGRITALAGQNGAGKTTAMNLASGMLRPDRGTIRIEGKRVVLSSPRAAAASGVVMVHQHFTLASQLTVAENLALASESLPPLIDSNLLRRRAEEAILRSGIRLGDVDRKVDQLSVGEKAKLELVKALNRDPRLLILDEPTSVLTPIEIDELKSVVKRLSSGGIAVVLITHKLPEIFDLADDIRVLREGRLVLESDLAGTDPAAISMAMLGNRVEPPLPRESVTPLRGPLALACRGVSTGAAEHHQSLERLSMEVAAGEIVAVVGVAGNGQRQLAELLRGLIPAVGGEVLLNGRSMSRAELATTAAVAHIPADRTRDGVVGELTVAENILLGHAPLTRASRRRVLDWIAAYDIRTRSPRQKARALSGGNQQKVVLARALEQKPQLLVASEPTRGLDLAATEFVHRRLRETADRGTAILLITSDLDEAFSLATTIHVMYRGRLSEPMTPGIAATRVAGLMAGVV